MPATRTETTPEAPATWVGSSTLVGEYGNLFPQVQTFPVSSIAKLEVLPASTSTNGGRAGEVADNGVGSWTAPPAVPVPSWPLSFSPQTQTSPAPSRASMWRSPTATASTPVSPGRDRGVEVSL